jgi:hypothetical protein
VITHKQLLRVKKDKSIDFLIKDGFWYGNKFATSVAINDYIAYIGMTNGVLAYNLKHNSQKWLIRNVSGANTSLPK